MNEVTRFEHLRSKANNPTQLYTIEESYLEIILRDIGGLFIKKIAEESTYNILDAICYIGMLGDLTVQQKCYLTFFLGRVFERDPHEFEQFILQSYVNEE